MSSRRLGVRHTPHMLYRGSGYFAGLAPDPEDPNSPDGRYRLANVPAQGRITVHDRLTLLCVADALSATDGTWQIQHLDTSRYFVVIGWDGRGIQNAAIQDWVKPAAMP